MNKFIVLLFFPFLLFLIFLALSSCLGDSVRARISEISFSHNYGRGLGSGSGAGGWEQIEMEDVLGADLDDE